jgi:hypothetical protein
MYSIVYKHTIKKPEVQLLRYNKNFYRKPIQQLAVIPQYNVLVILAGKKFLNCLTNVNENSVINEQSLLMKKLKCNLLVYR